MVIFLKIIKSCRLSAFKSHKFLDFFYKARTVYNMSRFTFSNVFRLNQPSITAKQKITTQLRQNEPKNIPYVSTKINIQNADTTRRKFSYFSYFWHFASTSITQYFFLSLFLLSSSQRVFCYGKKNKNE